VGEEAQVGVGDRPHLRYPKVITEITAVHAAVENLLADDVFCFDVETNEPTGSPNPRVNEVTWIGLGGPGQVYLIPMGHPKGVTLVREHKERTPAYTLFGPEDPRSYTKTGKISMRLIEHTVPAVFARPPDQLTPAEVFDALRPLFFSDRAKLGHNVKYDLQSIAKYYEDEIPPGPYHDTILIRHTLAEDLTDYGLKPTTCDWLGIPKVQRKTFYPDLGKQGVHNFGLDDVARYLAKDIRFCWLQFCHFFPRLVRKGLLPIYEFEMTLYPVLMEIEQRGFSVDSSRLDTVRVDLEKRIHELEEQCWLLAGDQFPLSNTDAKRWIMFGEGKPAFGTDMNPASPTYMRSTKRPLRSQRLRVITRTEETEVPQITQAVLTHYADRGNKMAEWLLEWSLLDKLRGTFVEGLSALLTDTGGALPTIHTSFKQHGTTTGRLSSATPNLQQLPRGSTIRDLFVAGPGGILIVADYDQIELRCCAAQSGDKSMTKVFMEGRDIHSEATAAALRIPAADVSKDMRQVGKTLNFAALYGAQAGKVAAVAGGSKQRGEQFLNRYYKEFSEIIPWKVRVLKEARARGDRASPFTHPPYVAIPPIGRQRRLPDLYSPYDNWRWYAERQAINAMIQGFASYITKMAMLALQEQLADLPAAMVVQVHDEVVVWTLEDRVDEVLPLVVSTMSDIRGTDGIPILGEIPLLVSAEVGYSWAEAKK
jgi:DNA polymerase I-like protein with 3'-5' exonuclease and polymerase domains